MKLLSVEYAAAVYIGNVVIDLLIGKPYRALPNLAQSKLAQPNLT